MENMELFIEDTLLELACRLDEEDVSEYKKQAKQFGQGYNYQVFVPAVYGSRRNDRLYWGVVRVVEEDGFRVSISEFTNGVMGRCNPKWKTIDIASVATTEPRICLLLHEWAHGMLHGGFSFFECLLDPAPFELEAEATCYIVSKALGIEPRSSVGYLKACYHQTGMDALSPTRVANIKRAATYQISALMASGLM